MNLVHPDPKKASIWMPFFLLWLGWSVCSAETLKSEAPSNQAFLQKMVQANWKQFQKYVPPSIGRNWIIVATDSASAAEEFVAALFREAAFSEGKRAIYLDRVKKPSDGVFLRLWVAHFNLDFKPISRRWFGSIRWVRSGWLNVRAEAVNLQSGQLIWAGNLEATREDTLTSREVKALRTGVPDFLKGNVVTGENHFWKAVQIAFLVSISVGIVGLFYSVRTS